MYTAKPIFALLLLAMIASSCLDNNTETGPVVDYGGISNFYVVNQSNVDLNATYKIRAGNRDSTVAVFSDSTTKIYDYGTLGGPPPPSSTFASIRFYNLSGDMTSPLLTIKPIDNENWNDATVKSDTAKKFELVITEKDLQ